MFYLRRIINAASYDWLHSWDDEWGTSCMVSKSKAMGFLSRAVADTACERANESLEVARQHYPWIPADMKFVVDGNPSPVFLGK